MVSGHSHSIVPGGLLVTSYTTRFTPFTSLMIRVAARPKKPMSKGKKSAVMPSLDVTARKRANGIVGAAVAHYAHRAHRQEHGEGLPDLVVEAGGADFFEIDRVGLAQDVELLLADGAGMRMARPGPGNGWRPTKASGRPSSRPKARTSSLNSSRSGSTSFMAIRSAGRRRCGAT